MFIGQEIHKHRSPKGVRKRLLLRGYKHGTPNGVRQDFKVLQLRILHSCPNSNLLQSLLNARSSRLC